MAQLDYMGAALGLFIAMTVALIVLLVVLRIAKARMHRRVRTARLGREEEVAEDRAYTALVTSEAIARELAEKGLESTQAKELLREARSALADGRTGRAEECAQEARGLLAELQAGAEPRGAEGPEESPLLPEGEIPESKPILGKEYAKNFLQAKFLLGMVKDAIGKGSSKRKKEARKLLKEAQAAFDEEAYDESLALCIQARYVVEGGKAKREKAKGEKGKGKESAAKAPKEAVCPQCDHPVDPEDAFCGKCGFRLKGPSACPECGAELAADDRFCRVCGTTLVPLVKTG